MPKVLFKDIINVIVLCHISKNIFVMYKSKVNGVTVFGSLLKMAKKNNQTIHSDGKTLSETFKMLLWNKKSYMHFKNMWLHQSRKALNPV